MIHDDFRYRVCKIMSDTLELSSLKERFNILKNNVSYEFISVCIKLQYYMCFFTLATANDNLRISN